MIPVQRPCLGAAELAAVQQVFETRWLGMGANTFAFEKALADFLGVRHVVAVNTGTSALHVALAVLDLKPGDEVIVPSLTFVASVQAIIAAGGTPVFCEVYPETLTLDVEDAKERLTPRTRAIMPVHFGGLAWEMDALLGMARDANVVVVEDAAHAFGSTYKGRQVGTLGDLTCFSFDPIKNITCGEGGAVTTDDDAMAARMLPKRLLGADRTRGEQSRNVRNPWAQVVTPGFRYHLSNINAAIGLVQLGRMQEFKERKQAIVRRYDEGLRGLRGLKLLRHSEETFPFFYVVRIADFKRRGFRAYLKERGIDSGLHYVPNHLQPLFADDRQSLPVTEEMFREILTLPLYYEMTDSDVDAVIRATRDFFQLPSGTTK